MANGNWPNDIWFPSFFLNPICPLLSLVYNRRWVVARRTMRKRWFTLPILILASGLVLAGAGKDCVFLNNPDEFTTNVERVEKAHSDLTSSISNMVHRALLSDRQGDQPAVQTLNAAT